MRNSFTMLLIAFSAAVCLGVLVNITVSAEYRKTEDDDAVISRAVRGRILDRNGAVLAESVSSGGRRYPLALCPHIIGSLSSDGTAQSGAELAFDIILSGRDGIDDSERISPRIDGSDVYLTIDSRLQQTAERILDTAAERSKTAEETNTMSPYSGEAGAIVLLDSRSGEVLAMANFPRYSLTSLVQDHDELLADPLLPLLDRAAQGLYRPGSVFKTVTAAAALSEGAVSPSTRFYCGSSLWAGGSVFTCLDSHGYIDIRQALGVSCNVFFYRTALSLGGDALKKYAELFGYGNAPDFELPAASGQIASFETLGYWNDAQLVQAAIGQSATVASPLQLACHALTLANSGIRYSPMLLYAVGSSKLRAPISPPPVSKIRDNGAFATIKEGMLRSSMNTYGEFALSLLSKPCAIKTGTPQSERGYDSTVIGFYPADDPEIAFAIVLESGVNAKHAVKELIEEWEQIQAQRR